MERPPFFPDPYFGWAFYTVLVALTALGGYLDLRRAVLPKKLTLSLLAVGVVFNIVRGAWLGSLGGKLSWLPTGNVWLGAADGFLFSLVGFVLTALLFVLFWMAKLCGGGDVKLFAALGAWVGFWHVLFIMLVSNFVRALLLIGRLGRNRLRAHQGKQQMTYALSVAISAAVVLLWTYRFDLNLAVRSKAAPIPARAEALHE
jgi:prepilin signal peptidase PulO-like enzyme (type II secretory pathway)